MYSPVNVKSCSNKSKKISKKKQTCLFSHETTCFSTKKKILHKKNFNSRNIKHLFSPVPHLYSRLYYIIIRKR